MGIFGELLRLDEILVEVFDWINKVNYWGLWFVVRVVFGWMVN